MARSRTRLLLVLASTAFGFLLSILVWNLRPEAPSVVFVDTVAEANQLLEERQQDGTPGEAATALPLDPLDPAGPLVRELLEEEIVLKIFPSLSPKRSHLVYDPRCYFWERGGRRGRVRFAEHPRGGFFVQTNAHGFRKSVEVRETPPGLRILVTGDSHTAGVVPNREQFGNLLEVLLDERDSERSHEVLNGGKGGYSFYNYVGVLEKFLELEPDVFVLALFGGNDFVGSVSPFRYFNRLQPGRVDRNFRGADRQRLIREEVAFAAQGFLQLLTFAGRKKEIALGEAAACQSLGESLRICDREGIEFVLVYIPPCHDVQPEFIQPQLDQAIRTFGLDEVELGVTNRLADRVLRFLAERGVRTVDMRSAYRASVEPCYWATDLHINTLGHALIAEALAEELGRLENR